MLKVAVHSSSNTTVVHWLYAMEDSKKNISVGRGQYNSGDYTISHITGYVLALANFLRDLDRILSREFPKTQDIHSTIEFHCPYKQMGGILLGTGKCQAESTKLLAKVVHRFRIRYPNIKFEFHDTVDDNFKAIFNQLMEEVRK